MKHLRIAILTCITIAAFTALFLGRSIGASAALMPQQPRISGACVWSTVASPNAGTSTNFLNGVAAISAHNVWAVGSYGNGNGGLTLVEHWNGKQWRVVTSPNVSGSLSDSLAGVAAISANNIWAVGNYIDASNTSLTLIEHWNGTSWSVVSSPDVPSLGNSLAAISAVSATDIWAVGNASGINGFQILIEHWNGSAWSIVSSSGTGQLNGVTAIAANDAWAVGSVSSPNNIQTLTEHWNGTKWSVVSSSGPGQASNTLNGVVAVSANNVWAVGDATNSVGPSATFTPLVERWNGRAWSVVTSPLQGTSDFLDGLAVVSANNIWAVGDYRSGIDPMGPYFTLVEHWNGSAWSVVKSPSPGSMASVLTAAAHVPATQSVWAVGYTQDSISQTLTEFHC